MGDLDRAIADYSKAAETNPQFAPAYNNRGNAYSAKGNLDLVFADYNKSDRARPEIGAFPTSAVEPPIGRRKSMIAPLPTSTRRSRSTPNLREPITCAASPTMNVDRRATILSSKTAQWPTTPKAIDIGPKFAAYNNRAWAHLKAGKAAQGLPDIEKSLELQPDQLHSLDQGTPLRGGRPVR
jgi:tetratricopeptide (TPR) repeat protein